MPYGYGIKRKSDSIASAAIWNGKEGTVEKARIYSGNRKSISKESVPFYMGG
jgi:hypothetical protein